MFVGQKPEDGKREKVWFGLVRGAASDGWPDEPAATERMDGLVVALQRDGSLPQLQPVRDAPRKRIGQKGLKTQLSTTYIDVRGTNLWRSFFFRLQDFKSSGENEKKKIYVACKIVHIIFTNVY